MDKMSSLSAGAKKLFEQSIDKAQNLDLPGLSDLSQKSIDKLDQHRSKLDSLGGEVTDLADLVGHWAKGTYRHIPWSSIVSSAAALLYFLNPFDFVPDFLVGIGLLDDLTVIAFVVKAIASDLDKFREWRKDQSSEEELDDDQEEEED